jgi:hypothetical protein
MQLEQRFSENDAQLMNNLDDCIRSAEVVAEVASTMITSRSTHLMPSHNSSRQHAHDRTALWVENHVLGPEIGIPGNDLLSSITSETEAQPITPSPSTVASTVVRVQSVVTPSMTTAALRETQPVSSFESVSVNFFDEVQPELIGGWLNEGKAQFSLGNYEDAAEYMRTVVSRARETQYEGKAEAIEESMTLLARCYCHLDA